MFLEINQIRKSYGSGESRGEVLKGIDLYVEQGEFCVLLGPSGSGKSTLLNIIGGIDQADSGDICIRGERMADMKEKKDNSRERPSVEPLSKIRIFYCVMNRQARWITIHLRKS